MLPVEAHTAVKNLRKDRESIVASAPGKEDSDI